MERQYFVIAFLGKIYEKCEIEDLGELKLPIFDTGKREFIGWHGTGERIMTCSHHSYQEAISTGIKDRDGEKLMPEGVLLDNYQKNPIVPFAHDYRTIPPAKNMWIKRDEKGLVAKTVFAKNQRADEYYQAYTEDVGGTGPLLNAFSVGFIPLEWKDTDEKAMEKDSDLPKRIYNKWELLEYSLVPIPSCTEALTIAIEKGLIPEGLKKDLEIEVEVEKAEEDREIELTIEDVKSIEKAHKASIGTEIATEGYEKVAKELNGDKEIEVEKDEPEFESKIAHLDGIVFEQGQWCVDKEGVKWMWDGAWIGEDGVPAKKEISIKELIELDEKGNIITKPETTENYHRIPVNSTCKITATITISAPKGIKATYCGKVKKIHTYLFDVDKWTMEEAQAWVKENHKGIEKCIQEYFTKGIIPEKEEHKEIIKSMIEEADEKLFKDRETVGELTDEINGEEMEEQDKLIEIETKEADEKQKYNCECIKCGHKLTSDKHCNEIKCPKCGGEMRRAERPGPGKEFDENLKDYIERLEAREVNFKDSLNGIRILIEGHYEKLLEEKDEYIADLKEGRVLSRKNRKIVKDAITALNAVLKADSAGSREDEETAEGTVTEREVEIEKDGEREFSKEDIARVVKEVSGEQMGEILEDAFKKALDPEKIKAMVGEGIKIELQKLRGKVT